MSAEALRAEIDELYEAFAGARRPQLMSSDPWAPDVEWIARQPLRKLPAKVINEFVFELGSSIGDGDDIRYLVPRLCELHLLGELQSLVDYPILFALQLTRARWETWSAREQAAIRAFLDSWLRWSISDRHAGELLDLVTSLAILFDDLSPWLAIIGARNDVAGVWSLLWLAEWMDSHQFKGRMSPPPFLAERPAQVEQIRTWLGDATHLARVESLRDRIGPTLADGEDLSQLFEEVTLWLQFFGAGQP